MKLYLLSQGDNSGYDTYDACVVCANNEEDARSITPSDQLFKDSEPGRWTDWAIKSTSIDCTEIGEANGSQERGVVLASFKAG